MNKKDIFLKTKNGFTLIEIVVVILISSIIMLASFEVFNVSNNIILKSTDKIEAKNIALLVEESIVNELKFANNIYVGKAKPGNGEWKRIVSPAGGEDFLLDEKLIISKDLISPFQLQITFRGNMEEIEGGNRFNHLVEVVIKVKKNSSPKEIYTLTRTIRLENMMDKLENNFKLVESNTIYYQIP